MARRQLDLFRASEPVDGRVRPAETPAWLHGVAERLPRHLRLGTSSWSFPGWAGIVYDQPAPQSTLSREGLAAYAAHPLLRTVSIDRSYYGRIEESTYAQWADDVPAGFRFVIKVDRAVTVPDLRSGSGAASLPNPLFLDPRQAESSTIAPALRGLGERAGVFLLQFSPFAARAVGGSRIFARRLGEFLNALPRGIPFAVEIRSPELFTPRLIETLAKTDAVYCHTVHPAMPGLAQQLAAVPANGFPRLVIRWMLHSGMRYDQARDHYHPFHRLVDEDPETRSLIAGACRHADRLDREAYVLINNKAEGSARLSATRLAESIAGT